jgi:hypothetical protein
MLKPLLFSMNWVKYFKERDELERDKMKILECLCNRKDEDSPLASINRESGNLKLGHERTCKIIDGKGSCGEDFYEDDGSLCRWCCQIIKMES